MDQCPRCGAFPSDASAQHGAFACGYPLSDCAGSTRPEDEPGSDRDIARAEDWYNREPE